MLIDLVSSLHYFLFYTFSFICFSVALCFNFSCEGHYYKGFPCLLCIGCFTLSERRIYCVSRFILFFLLNSTLSLFWFGAQFCMSNFFFVLLFLSLVSVHVANNEIGKKNFTVFWLEAILLPLKSYLSKNSCVLSMKSAPIPI